eukprot:10916814-Heterocapsa_arctica.AAC.1
MAVHLPETAPLHSRPCRRCSRLLLAPGPCGNPPPDVQSYRTRSKSPWSAAVAAAASHRQQAA